MKGIPDNTYYSSTSHKKYRPEKAHTGPKTCGRKLKMLSSSEKFSQTNDRRLYPSPNTQSHELGPMGDNH